GRPARITSRVGATWPSLGRHGETRSRRSRSSISPSSTSPLTPNPSALARVRSTDPVQAQEYDRTGTEHAGGPMPRFVELRRHTDNDGDVLTGEGVAAALRVGGGLAGGYRLGVSTGAQRATQTLACFLAALGQRVPGGVL